MNSNVSNKIFIIVLGILYVYLFPPCTGAAAWQIDVVANDGICNISATACTDHSDCPDGEQCRGAKRNISLGLDSNDKPHISYNDAISGSLRYAHFDNSWQIETVDDNGQHTSLALDSNDNPCISYYSSGNGLKYAHYNGSWQIETVDDHGLYTSIALDSNNNPHISYYEDGINRDLKYARFDGVDWQIETVDSVGIVGAFTSLALDNDNNPHISYYDETNADLKYAYFFNNEWYIQVVDSDGSVGKSSSLALDSNDRPHISYFKNTHPVPDDLKYAHFDGSWQIVIVDSDPFNNPSTSFSLDSNDNPRISYSYFHQPDKFGLRYAWCDKEDGGICNWQIDYDCDTAGSYTSLALDSDDNPHISYYTNQHELKYAFLDNTCEGNFDCDLDCDGGDAALFKSDFGRSMFKNPCANPDPCNGDFDCDVDVDGSDATIFKTDFGRSPFKNPCPNCAGVEGCTYP